jgi:hypothetical protein
VSDGVTEYNVSYNHGMCGGNITIWKGESCIHLYDEGEMLTLEQAKKMAEALERAS